MRPSSLIKGNAALCRIKEQARESACVFASSVIRREPDLDPSRQRFMRWALLLRSRCSRVRIEDVSISHAVPPWRMGLLRFLQVFDCRTD